MLIAVRKPGRPLISCPHITPHQDCDCRRVVAAIPRKQNNCPCPKTEDSPPTQVPRPPSPTKHTFKVDKSITTSNGRPMVRKPLDGYADRIDTENFNVVQPPQFRNQQLLVPATNGFLTQINTQINTYNGFIPPDMSLQNSNGPWQNLNGQFPTNGQPFAPPIESPTPRSCCAPKQPASNGNDNGDGNGNMNGLVNGNGMAMEDGLMYHYTPAHMKMDSGVAGLNLSTPSLYNGSTSSSESSRTSIAAPTTQPPYSLQDTFSTPYNLNAMSQSPFYQIPMSYAQDIPISAPAWSSRMFSQQNPLAYNAQSQFAISIPQTLTDAPQNGSHDKDNCNCGDDCNCLACIVHPHNLRTTQYVQKAAQEQWNNGDSSLSPTNGNSPNNSLGDDVVVDGVDFLMADFWLPGECWGEEVTCPCGPECECPGCSVHGNGSVGLQSSECGGGQVAGTNRNANGNGIKEEEDESDEDDKPKKSCCG
jgi:hypothetical protein